MLPTQDSFEFDYYGRDIGYGRGCLGTLESYLHDDFGPTAAYIVDNAPLSNGPEELDPTVEEVEPMLRDA